MPNLNKYFWDRTLNSSRSFKTIRLLEYASFPDLLKAPFEQIREEISRIDLERLRTGERRKAFLSRLKRFAPFSDSWDGALKDVCGLRKRRHQGIPIRLDEKPMVRMARLVRADAVDRSFDLEFWKKMGAEERFKAAWQMVLEVNTIKGSDSIESGLQRSVQHIHRVPG
jgi:hypothetical protein